MPPPRSSRVRSPGLPSISFPIALPSVTGPRNFPPACRWRDVAAGLPGRRTLSPKMRSFLRFIPQFLRGLFPVLALAALPARAQTPPATWIWYPGDFEIWLSNEVQARRVERDAFAPPFWRMDSAYPSVIFTKKTTTTAPETTVDDTIPDLGPGARDSEIFAECSRRCKEQGLTPPSWNAVRTRTGKPVLNPDLRSRMRRDADFVLDACPLDLTVHVASAEPQLAVLTAIIHVDSGEVLGFHLDGQPVETSAVAHAFVDAIDHRRSGPHSRHRGQRLIVSTALQSHMSVVASLAQAAKLRLDTTASLGLAPGTALTNAVGRKIGRIPFAPRARVKARPDLAVPLHHAQAVVGELLARRSLAGGRPCAGLVSPKNARSVRDLALGILEDCS